jgi:hypothetical protein
MVREPDATMQPTLQDNQLMSKHRILGFKPQLRLEWRGQDGQNETEQPNHSASLGDSITPSTRMRFSVRTIRFTLDLPGMRCGIVNRSRDSPAMSGKGRAGAALLGLPIGSPKISNASARLSAMPGEIVRVEPFVDCGVIARAIWPVHL